MTIKAHSLGANYSDIVLRHNKSVVKSRSECDTSTYIGKYKFVCPVFASNMKAIITPEICKQFDLANWFYVYHRIDGPADVENFVKFANSTMNIVSISVGVKQEWVSLIARLKSMSYIVDYFTVDVALSFNDNILPVLDAIKFFYPDAYIIVGNGATADWVNWIKEKTPADCVKVGIGVSSSCRTRQYTGFGSSTISSLVECKEAAGDSLKIISDGGITCIDSVPYVGDFAKALVAGADYVMSGVAFSRCVDSPSLVTGYYGNASSQAKMHEAHIEGATVIVPTNGYYISGMMKLIQESLRSSISYSGGKTITEMKDLTEWEYCR